MTLTIKTDDGYTITIETPNAVTIDEYVEAVKAALLAVGFSPATVASAFGDEEDA